MPNELTIRLGGHGDHVTVVLLIATLEKTLDMLRELDQEMSADREGLRWEVVRASMESPLTITVAPAVDPEEQQNGKAKRGERTVGALIRGMRAIQTSPSVPPYFDEKVLSSAKEMIEEAAKEQAKLTFLAPNEEPVEPTSETAANIVRAVAKITRGYADVGTIEGLLDTISVHKGKKSGTVWEFLTNNRITCALTDQQLAQAKELLGRRVAVTGRVTYKGSKPSSMGHVESIRALRDVDELPQLADIGQLDITGGVSPEEYIRRMRDAR